MAKKSVGTLSAILTLNSKGFSGGLAKAVNGLNQFGKRLRAGIGTVLKWGSVLIGAASAAFVAFTKKSFSTIDATAKLSDRLGIATEKLSALQFAAGLAGGSAQDMNKALEGMAKRVSEAKDGLGTGQIALKKLGLSTKEFFALKPDQQFDAIAKQLRGVSSQQDRVRIAFDIFGRSGTKILNLMQSTGFSTEKATDQARSLGLTFTRFDASKVEQANDTIAALKSSFLSAFNAVAVKLAPVVTALGRKLLDATDNGKVLSDALITGFEFAKKAAGKFATALSFIRNVVSTVQRVFLKLGEIINKVFVAAINVANKLPGINISTKKFEQNIAVLRGLRESNFNAQIARNVSDINQSPESKVQQFFTGAEMAANRQAAISTGQIPAQSKEQLDVLNKILTATQQWGFAV